MNSIAINFLKYHATNPPRHSSTFTTSTTFIGCETLLIAIAPCAAYVKRVEELVCLEGLPIRWVHYHHTPRIPFISFNELSSWLGRTLRSPFDTWTDGQLNDRCGKKCVATDTRTTIVYIHENCCSTTNASFESMDLDTEWTMLFHTCHTYGSGF